MVVGNYREALPHLTLAASLYQPNEHREFAFRHGQDVGATALCYLSWALWHNGFLAQATLTADRAIRHAREFGHAHTLVYTLWHAATVSLLARDAVRVAALANAVTRVKPGDTAFPHRFDHYDGGPWAIWQDPADTDRCIRWARECWDALRPFYEPSAYVNAVDDAISDDDERVKSAYGANFERLTSLKTRYDPTNLFRLNANIRPSL